MFKEFCKVTQTCSNGYISHNHYETMDDNYDQLLMKLKEGWEIITSYSFRTTETKSYQHSSGTYINEEVDGDWYVTYLLGRKELPATLYG